MANCGALDIDLGPLGCISLHFSVLFDLGGGALSSTSTVVDVSGVGLCLFDLLNGALSSLFLFLDMNKWSLSLIIDVNWDVNWSAHYGGRHSGVVIRFCGHIHPLLLLLLFI
eukprot:598783_1